MNGVAVVHRISCTAIEPRHGRGGTARHWPCCPPAPWACSYSWELHPGPPPWPCCPLAPWAGCSCSWGLHPGPPPWPALVFSCPLGLLLLLGAASWAPSLALLPPGPLGLLLHLGAASLASSLALLPPGPLGLLLHLRPAFRAPLLALLPPRPSGTAHSPPPLPTASAVHPLTAPLPVST
jgi:hypothetical protein